MPRFVMTGFDISSEGVNFANLVLNTPGGMTTTTYAYNFFGYINWSFLNNGAGIPNYDRLRYDGDSFDSGADFTFLRTSWGAGRQTDVFGLDFFFSGFLAPVAGDSLPNFTRDDGDILFEFVDLLNETGGEKEITKGPFKTGRTIQLDELFNDDTTGPVFQGGKSNNTLTGASKDDLIVGAAGDDMGYGKSGADTLMMGLGDDQGYGGSGGDVISGYAGSDELFGGKGADRLFGATGDDKLKGQGGNDKLFGGDNADRLDGGKGNDNLTGGKGADTFVFAKGHDVDTVQGFGKGADMLELNDSLWTGTLTAEQVVDQFATKGGGNITFDFGGGDQLILKNYTKLGTLDDFIDIV